MPPGHPGDDPPQQKSIWCPPITLFDAAMPEGPAQVDPEFLEHLRYEDQPEPEPPWHD